MTSTTTLAKSLGQTLGDSTTICQITSANITSPVGLHLSVVQLSGLDRNYRVTIPPNATGLGVWKRLVPYDKTEKFFDGNHWAVDLSSFTSEHTHTIALRVVRTKAGTPPSATSLKCKVVGYAPVGSAYNIADSSATSVLVENAGIYEGALVTQQDGMVGINTDAPSHVLDVVGNTNVSETYKIGGTNVLTASALGNSVTTSNLTTVGNLESLQVSGTVFLTGLGYTSTSNLVHVDSSTGRLTFSPGTTGSQGPVGAQGVQGVRGATGASGATGDREGATNGSPNVLTNDQATRYLNGYVDLRNAFGTDIEAAKTHWINDGYAEGRTIPGAAGAVGPAGATGAQGPQGSENFIYNIVSTNSVSTSSSTAIVTYLTSGTLEVGTWSVWASGRLSNMNDARTMNIYLRNNVLGADFDTKSYRQWTENPEYPRSFSQLGVTTLSSSGTVSFRFAAGGSYQVKVYDCVLKCVKIS